MEKSPRPLHLPDVPVVQYEQNFIKVAACELRFPTLLEFETAPPTQLQKLLRKDYPHYEPIQSMTVNSTSVIGHKMQYIFRSRKRDWMVTFNASAIILETNRYTNFEEFSKRLELLIEKSQPLLDSDFFTRVGLRYIDEVPIDDGKLSGWIRDDLVLALTAGVFGDVERYLQEVRGSTTVGNYTFKHGMKDDNPDTYFLDFDFYEVNVPSDSVISLVRDFNRESFRFFHWTLGHKSLKRLGNNISN
jgi:uncharacterized protein (TIGR04255 family)